MNKAIRILGYSAAVPIMAALVIAPGCGSGDFLGLEDYQRELLAGGLLAAALLSQGAADEPAASGVDGRDGEDGLRCWDVNGDGVANPGEDVNGDGNFTVADCAGTTGVDGPAGPDGPAGISCWDLNGNGSGEADEDINGDGDFDAYDCQGAAGDDGPAGPAGPGGRPGPPGAPGLSLFQIFVDDFFSTESTMMGELPIVVVRVEEPALGVGPFAGRVLPDAIAFRTPIPEMYDAGNDVSMRLYFYRTGVHEEDCFVMRLDARRLRAGSDIEVYGAPRWIRVDGLEMDDGGDLLFGGTADVPGALVVVDLPINTVAGLGFPNDLAVADFLAFELSTYWRDGRAYQLLGVEFTEHRAGTAQLAGGVVFTVDDAVSCGIADCNENLVDDLIDIANGTSEDCNENEIPDECDLAEGTSEDCNENSIPDECDVCVDDARGATASPENEQAVVDGLAYLASIQNPDGSWSMDWGGQTAGNGGGSGCYDLAITAMVILKFEDRAMDLGFLDPLDEGFEYHQLVADGLAYITNPVHQYVIDISSEPAADGDADGVGLVIKNCAGDHHDVYPTALTLMALASSRRPDLYTDLVQDALDWMVFAQNNADCGVHRGGWGYGANDCTWSDNSNGGYASLGVGFAAASPPHGFGLTVPQFVLDELNLWVDALQDPVNGDANDGGSHYDPGGYWVNILKTGNLLYEMGMVGDTPESQRVKDAIDYIERHWTVDNMCDVGWLRDQQTMFTMMKGLEGLNIDYLDLDGDGNATDDWFAEVEAHLISTQQADGSWPPDCWGDKVLSTAWALLTLERAVAPPRPTGACCHGAALVCEEDVFEEDCGGDFDDWFEGLRCADLDPPCAPPDCSPDCNGNLVPDECELGEPPDHTCCDADHGAGCSDEAIQACVCAVDAYCCDGEWDGDCVAQVESLGCGSCGIENDCNANGVLDECDVISGTSPDCNGNGLPDACDIADGTAEDCNENGIPDECDVADGSDDCDQNGIPDECQLTGVMGIRIAQESEAGAGDFDDNILGYLEPYPSTLTAEEYYRYALGFAASFNGAGIELTYERSHLFMVENTDGLSLFVVHDRPENADGGSATTSYTVSGDPDGVAISVLDDPTSDVYTGNPGDSFFTAVHVWSPCCTDGLALTGFDGTWFVIMEITSSLAGMSDWAAYAPDQAPILLALVQGQRVRIDLVSMPGGTDCNENGVLDVCELEGNDCNENDVLDECDIANGTSEDCQPNGIPDECDGGCVE